MCGRPTRSFSQWIWSQFTLADHAFVSLGNALYLIFKFAVAHRQSFDDDIRALPHIAKPYHFTLPIEGKSTQKGTNIGGDKARQGSRNFTQICAGIRASERGEILRVGAGLSIEQIKGAAARKAQRSCASDFNCA